MEITGTEIGPKNYLQLGRIAWLGVGSGDGVSGLSCKCELLHVDSSERAEEKGPLVCSGESWADCAECANGAVGGIRGRRPQLEFRHKTLEPAADARGSFAQFVAVHNLANGPVCEPGTPWTNGTCRNISKKKCGKNPRIVHSRQVDRRVAASEIMFGGSAPFWPVVPSQ